MIKADEKKKKMVQYERNPLVSPVRKGVYKFEVKKRKTGVISL